MLNRSNLHGHPQPSAAMVTAISMLIDGNLPSNHGSCNRNPTLLPRQATGSHVDHGGARQREPAYAILVMYYHKQIEQPLKRGILQSILDSKARHRNLNALRSWLLYLLAYVGVANHGRGC